MKQRGSTVVNWEAEGEALKLLMCGLCLQELCHPVPLSSAELQEQEEEDQLVV